MRLKGFFVLSILALLAGFAPHTAEAGRYPWYNWIVTPDPEDNTRYYMEEGKIPHNNQFDNDPWKPEDWTEARGSKKEVVDGFYKAGFIVGYDDDGDPPILRVGREFLRLSDREKNHVVKYMDYVHGATEQGKFIYLVMGGSRGWWIFGGTGKPVGVYTAQGLQLQ